MPREITPTLYKEDINESTLPYAFWGGSAVIYNNKIHILGSTDGEDTTKHYSWNGTSWIEEVALPYDFYASSAVVYNDKIHILGSYRSGNYTKHYSWDGTTWLEESTLPYQFFWGSAVVYDNKIHILGGFPNNSRTKHYSWDGTSWMLEYTLPYSFYESSAVVYNNKIHILGSATNGDQTKHYSWSNDSWIEESTLPYNFYYSSAVVYGNKIHILGGSSSSSTYKNHYSWDGTSWIEESILPYDFYGGSSITYNDKIHILGGYIGQSNHYALEYYFNTNVNKVDFGDENLIDLTEDTLEVSSQLLKDLIAHDKRGNFIRGSRPIYYKENSSKYALVCKQELQSEEGVDKDAIFLGGQIIKLRVPTGTNNAQLVSLMNDGVTESVVNLTTSLAADYRDKFFIKKVHYITSNFCLIEHYNYTGDVAQTGISIRSILIKQDGSLVLGAAQTWGGTISATQTNLQHDMEWIPAFMDGRDFFVAEQLANTTAGTLRIRGYRTYINTVTGGLGYSTAILFGNACYYANSYVPDLSLAPNKGGIFISHNTTHRCVTYPEYQGSARNLTIDNTGTDMAAVDITNHHMLGRLQNGLVVTAKEHDKLYLWSYDNTSTTNVYTKINDFNFSDFGKYFVNTSTLPYGSYRGAAVVYDNKIHILGSSNSSYYTKHYSWNGALWSEESTLPYDFYYSCAVVYNNKIHILGSYSSPYTQHYSWDGVSWTQESALPYNFYYGCAVVYDNKIHILGGGETNEVDINHYSWDGTSWTQESTLPYEFYRGSAIVYDNKIHILGSSNSSNRQKHYSWNGTSWSEESTLPYPFYQGSVVIYGNKIHILGGYGSSYNTKHYSWNETSWTQELTLPYNFYGGYAVIYDNGIHILGGTNNSTYHYSLPSNYFNILSFSNDVLLLDNGRRIQVELDNLTELEPVELQYAQCPTSLNQIGPESDLYNGVFIYGD